MKRDDTAFVLVLGNRKPGNVLSVITVTLQLDKEEWKAAISTLLNWMHFTNVSVEVSRYKIHKHFLNEEDTPILALLVLKWKLFLQSPFFPLYTAVVENISLSRGFKKQVSLEIPHLGPWRNLKGICPLRLRLPPPPKKKHLSFCVQIRN